jgi:hypothetical protein
MPHNRNARIIRVGDVVSRDDPFEHYSYGVVIGFDSDDDIILIWSSGVIEEEYLSAMSLASES